VPEGIYRNISDVEKGRISLVYKSAAPREGDDGIQETPGKE
jgi:hypothetical protein